MYIITQFFHLVNDFKVIISELIPIVTLGNFAKRLDFIAGI